MTRWWRDGSIFQTTSDTEVLLHLYARSRRPAPEQALVESVTQAQGAFSLVWLTKDRLIAARDPHGFRPLTLGRLGDAYIVVFRDVRPRPHRCQWVRDIEPGEMFVVSPGGVSSVFPFPSAQGALHLRARVLRAPDSLVFGQSVNEVRTDFGRRLAAEHPVPAESCAVPDSGVCAATGYAEMSGLPLQMGLIRNHYVGRTFIEPHQSIRHFGVRVKLNPVRSILEGRRVVLVDDSIVRGTTTRKIVKMVRPPGATEVHMRISCPPTVSPCFYGVDTPRRSELIAATHSIDEIRRYIGADSLGYLSLDGLLGGVGPTRSSYCTSCYTGTTRWPSRATKPPTSSSRSNSPNDAVPSLALALAGLAARPWWPSRGPRTLRLSISSVRSTSRPARRRRGLSAEPRRGIVSRPACGRGQAPDDFVRYRALSLLAGFWHAIGRADMRDASHRSETTGCGQWRIGGS